MVVSAFCSIIASEPFSFDQIMTVLCSGGRLSAALVFNALCILVFLSLRPYFGVYQIFIPPLLAYIYTELSDTINQLVFQGD